MSFIALSRVPLFSPDSINLTRMEGKYPPAKRKPSERRLPDITNSRLWAMIREVLDLNTTSRVNSRAVIMGKPEEKSRYILREKRVRSTILINPETKGREKKTSRTNCLLRRKKIINKRIPATLPMIKAQVCRIRMSDINTIIRVGRGKSTR